MACLFSQRTDTRAEMLVCVNLLKAALVADIPDPERLVVTSAYDVFATRMENDAANPIVMSCQREQTHARTDVPHLNINNLLRGIFKSLDNGEVTTSISG